jgi:tRNA(Ile)-lysidine synthase
MHPRSGRTIRPLLDCRRAELRAFLAERGLSFVEDTTNTDVSIPRNRVRSELIPLLEERFNPSVVDVLANQAELARDEWLWMLEAVAAVDVGSVAALTSAPRALRRMALWRAMTEVAGGRTVSLQHVDAALRMVESNVTNRCVDAPGHVVERIGDRIVLKSGRSSDIRARPAVFHYPLSIPGEVSLPQHGCILSAQFADGAYARSATMSSRATAMVAVDSWTPPLSVRNRRPGDRFRPFGLDGQKKLQDFLVDRKVARAERDRVPLVVDADDRIVWVAGHEIDEAFRVTDAARAVLILTLRLV